MIIDENDFFFFLKLLVLLYTIQFVLNFINLKLYYLVRLKRNVYYRDQI